MKLIVCGGRDFINQHLLNHHLDSIHKHQKITTLIHGDAIGADKMAGLWGIMQTGIEVLDYPANWEQHGKSAGPIRNAEMANVGQYCLAFWDGKSRGTMDMITQATKRGLNTKVVSY